MASKIWIVFDGANVHVQINLTCSSTRPPSGMPTPAPTNRPTTLPVSSLPGRVLSGIAVIALVLAYCIIKLPDWPRLDRNVREAFILAIGNYTGLINGRPLRVLSGALPDGDRMNDALSDAGFTVTIHRDVKTGKTMTKGKYLPDAQKNTICGMFHKWCVAIQKGADVFVYYAGHVLKFEGTQWMVPAKARLSTSYPQSIAFQCVELNWIRYRASREKPTVTIYAFDCCDEIVEIDDDRLKDHIKSWRQVVQKHIVHMKMFNMSRSALNVFIFRGAASETQAKEGAAGGAFTTAFIEYMQSPGRTLDELSQLVRSELVKEENESLEPDVKNERAYSCQITETTNFLQFEKRGWTFFEQPTMCFGFMPHEVENWLVRRKQRCYGNDEVKLGGRASGRARTVGDIAELANLGQTLVGSDFHSEQEDLQALMSMMSFDASECHPEVLAVIEGQSTELWPVAWPEDKQTSSVRTF